MTLLSRSVLIDADTIRSLVPALGGGGAEPDPVLAARFALHFPTLHRLFRDIYGERPDALEALVSVVELAASAWAVRPAELRALDEAREAEPELVPRQPDAGGCLLRGPLCRHAGGDPRADPVLPASWGSPTCT